MNVNYSLSAPRNRSPRQPDTLAPIRCVDSFQFLAARERLNDSIVELARYRQTRNPRLIAMGEARVDRHQAYLDKLGAAFPAYEPYQAPDHSPRALLASFASLFGLALFMSGIATLALAFVR